MYRLESLKLFWKNHPLWASMVVFLFVFICLYFIVVLSPGNPLAGDHYFHFKYAYLLRTEGLKVVENFDWISPAGEIGNGHRYTVSLFQIALIPFTFITNQLLGLGIADIFFGAVAIGLVYYVLRKSKVKYPLFFALSLLTMSYFTMRLLIGRAFVLATVLVFLEMYLAVEKKYKILFFVVVFHILWHQSTYFMPIIVIGMVETARYLVENKFYLKNSLATILAVIVGTAFFPGFPKNLINWMKTIFQIQSTNINDVGSMSIGGLELDKKDFMHYFATKESLLFLTVFCIISVIFLYLMHKREKIDWKIKNIKKQIIWIYGLFIFLISMLLGSIAVSGRFFDFFFPTVFVLSAFIVTVIIKLNIIEIDDYYSKFVKVGIIIVLGVMIGNAVIIIYGKANSFDYEPAKKTAQWIQNNSTKRERVFLSNWGVFTLVFFTNSYNVYTTGIEPMALKSYDESLYWKYYNMFRYSYYCDKLGDCENEIEQKIELYKKLGEEERKKAEKENGRKIVNSIKKDFDSKFVVSTSDGLTTVILLNPELIEKYISFRSDKYKGPWMKYTVFKLK